jgi:phosphatidylserine synthase
MVYAKVKRPWPITTVCIMGYIWMILVLPGMFAPDVKKIGDFVPMMYGLILAFSFISIIGVWHMKRWGVEMYTLIFFIKTAFFILTGQFTSSSYFGVFFSLVFIFVFSLHYKRMDKNL